MPVYLIKGESGKTLGAGGYWLGDTLKAVAATMRFAAGGMDRLTWTARTADLLAGETVLPDKGQRVELFYDLGSFGQIRIFRGWVTSSRPVPYGTEVTVDGPWQFLLNTPATSVKTLNGSSDTRPTIDLAAGSLAASISTVVNRAIAEGLPLVNGGFAGSPYNLQKMKLSGETYADVLSELMRWLPDALLYFDYQSAPTANPSLSVIRRGVLGAASYTAGTAPLKSWGIDLRPESRPDRVELKYITRQADGRPRYEMQAAGSGTADKTLRVVISGDENDTYLPKDDYASYVLQTSNANTTLNNTRAALLPIIPQVVTSRAQFSGKPSSTDVVLANGETITQTLSSSSTRIYPQPLLQFLNADTGAVVSRIGKHFVLTKEPPEWAGNLLANVERVKITGRIYKLVESTLYQTLTGGSSLDAPPPESWVDGFPWSNKELLSGRRFSATIPGYAAASTLLYALDFELETYLTTTNQAVPQTYYKPQEFDYNSPASGQAAAMLAAMAFTPAEGVIELASDGPTAPGLASAYNIIGADARFATMNALPRSVTLDLLKHTTRIELGPPTRFDFRMSGKVRASAQSNITITP